MAGHKGRQNAEIARQHKHRAQLAANARVRNLRHVHGQRHVDGTAAGAMQSTGRVQPAGRLGQPDEQPAAYHRQHGEEQHEFASDATGQPAEDGDAAAAAQRDQRADPRALLGGERPAGQRRVGVLEEQEAGGGPADGEAVTDGDEVDWGGGLAVNSMWSIANNVS